MVTDNTKRKRTRDSRTSVTYDERGEELSDSGSDSEFIPVHKKPKKHLKPEPAKGYRKKAGRPPGAQNKNKQTVRYGPSTSFENLVTFKKPNKSIHNIKKKT